MLSFQFRKPMLRAGIAFQAAKPGQRPGPQGSPKLPARVNPSGLVDGKLPAAKARRVSGQGLSLGSHSSGQGREEGQEPGLLCPPSGEGTGGGSVSPGGGARGQQGLGTPCKGSQAIYPKCPANMMLKTARRKSTDYVFPLPRNAQKRLIQGGWAREGRSSGNIT